MPAKGSLEGQVAAAPTQTAIQQQLTLVSQLVERRDAGVLTEAEFEVKKAQILRP